MKQNQMSAHKKTSKILDILSIPFTLALPSFLLKGFYEVVIEFITLGSWSESGLNFIECYSTQF